MAKGKWIKELTAATPLNEAARHVLNVRLGRVLKDLARMLKAPDEDPEAIHQLRVGTRRATAALDIFALCLPRKVYRSARKQLRRIRRAAGEARDWDVFLDDLTKHPRTPETQPGLDVLIGYVTARRIEAQTQWRQAFEEDSGDLEHLVAETWDAVRKPQSGPSFLIDLALPQLVDLLTELSQAAEHRLDDYEHLHQVRIIGKRLRYAMEVFAGCFAPPFRETLYPAVEEMQNILGRANDSFVASRRLAALGDTLRKNLSSEWPRFRPGIEGLRLDHEARLLQGRQCFLNWWDLWRPPGNVATLIARLEELQLDSRPDLPATADPAPRPSLVYREPA